MFDSTCGEVKLLTQQVAAATAEEGLVSRAHLL
jgi:hypothetical protein